jgi:hypothetical protein
MISSWYDITIYKKTLRLRRSISNSYPLGIAFPIIESRMIKPYRRTPITVLIDKENDCYDQYQLFCELNSFYRALINFEKDKGFSDPKFKYLKI